MEHRAGTFSDYQKRMIAVLVFIDQHLNEPMTVAELARVANFSPFHFHRVFRAFLGEPLHKYVRRLRLERAALQLRHTEDPITEITFNVGFDTPAAFTRAFRERFGTTPSGFREQNRGRLKAEEETEMNPEIRTLQEQPVIFVRRSGPYQTAADDAWRTLMKQAFWRLFFSRSVKTIGIVHDSPEITDESQIRYDACLTVSGAVKPKGEVGTQTIAGGRYAVFLHRGSYDQLSETYDQIFAEWLPQSSCRLRNAPCFEVYLNRNPKRTRPENLRTEIHVPVE